MTTTSDWSHTKDLLAELVIRFRAAYWETRRQSHATRLPNEPQALEVRPPIPPSEIFPTGYLVAKLSSSSSPLAKAEIYSNIFPASKIDFGRPSRASLSS